MPEFQIIGGDVKKVGLWPGTVVKLPDGRRFKVTKLNPKNVKLMGTDGGTYNLNRVYAASVIDEDQSWDGPKEKSELDLYLERREFGATLGTVVKLKGAYAGKYPGKYVVIAMPNNGTFRLAKLGGDGGRYLRNFKATDLEIVEAE